MSDKLEIAQIWFKRVWTDEDETAIDEMFISDGLAKGLGSYLRENGNKFSDHERIGPGEFKEFHRTLLNLLGNVEVEVTMSMEKDDWLALLCVLKANRRNTDEPIQTTGTIFVKIINGQLVEAYNHFDFISLFSQLGYLPEDAFSQCLSGKSIGH